MSSQTPSNVSSMPNDCDICTHPFNKTVCKPVTCCHCNFIACKTCVCTFILGKFEEPGCMNCNKPFNQKFLTSSLGKTFTSKQLKEHRENVLFEREKALIPSTQVHVYEYLECKKLEKKYKENLELIMKIENENYYIKKTLDNKNEEKNNDKASVQFKNKCKNGECNGFLNKDWSCIVCERMSCSKCHGLKDVNVEHECNEDDVKTVLALRRDTKPCPGCRVPIHKYDGCDQMFCTECKTIFDWRTGVISNSKVIHNPHYYEWVRERNGGLDRNPEDIECGREIDDDVIYKVMQFDKTRCLEKLCIRFLDARQRFIVPDGNVHAYNLEQRIKYIVKEITPEQFKKHIQKKEKEVMKKQELAQVFLTYSFCFTEYIHEFIANKDKDTTVKKIQDLQTYINGCFVEVSKVWGCKVYSVHP